MGVLGCRTEGGNLTRVPHKGQDVGASQLWPLMLGGNWAPRQGSHRILGKQEKETGLPREPLTPSLLQSETARTLGPVAGRIVQQQWPKAWGPM